MRPAPYYSIAVTARALLDDMAPRFSLRGSATEYEHLSTERGGVGVNEMRAFSLFGNEVPVIALNGGRRPPRLCSLLHEYAHQRLGGRITLRPKRGQCSEIGRTIMSKA